VSSNNNVAVESLETKAPAFIRTVQSRALVVAVLAGIGAIIGFIIEPSQAFHSWLVGFAYSWGLTTGPMAVLMLWYLSGGQWGMPIRRILESAMKNLWLVALYFIPVVIGAKAIYAWTHPENMQEGMLRNLGEHFLNLPLFILRAVLYFIVWGILVVVLSRISKRLDSPPPAFLGRVLAGISGAGMVIYFYTATFATVDWFMSMIPGWPSTVYSLIQIVGQGLLAFCLCIVLSRFLVEYQPMATLMNRKFFHDIGKLTFAFVMLWAYLSFSQWLIIWSGNMPEEIRWYLPRLHGGWQYGFAAMWLFHFAVPFSLLLSQSLKKNVRKLVWIAVLLLFMRYFELFWQVEPQFHSYFHYSWLDAVIPVFMVSVWLVFFCRNYMSRPILTLYDSRLPVTLGQLEEQQYD
jgi:hypothetical protein